MDDTSYQQGASVFTYQTTAPDVQQTAQSKVGSSKWGTPGSDRGAKPRPCKTGILGGVPEDEQFCFSDVTTVASSFARLNFSRRGLRGLVGPWLLRRGRSSALPSATAITS